MAEAKCHYCTREAEAECPTCGRLYCGEHGEDVCLRCLAPESATPSARVFRGSIVALGIGSLLAIFLVARPPESKSDQDTVRIVATSTPIVGATATPTPRGTQAARTQTTSASPSATAVGSATAAPGNDSYTVKSGDTVSGIAAQFGISSDALLAANPSVSAANLQIGEVLKIPR